MAEEARLELKDNKIIAWIGADDSAKRLLECLAGVRKPMPQDALFQKLTDECPELLQMTRRYVPDDIVCYSNLTVSQFLHGIVIAQEEPLKAEEEKKRLVEVFEINPEEKLLDMTFEQNRLVAMTQALIAMPELLLLQDPHDMIGAKKYRLLLDELVRLHKQGSTIMIAAKAYDDIVLHCERYLYLKDGLVKADYLREELIRPAKVVTLIGGDPAQMQQEKVTVLEEKKNRVRFIYKEENMQELAKRLRETRCSDFTVEDITREELIFENYERWSL